jgi:hypothetical protein
LFALYSLAVALGAALLFLIEPMEAKALLPELGGSPGVWTVSLVFYQTALLAGYAYAHGLVRSLSLRQTAIVHAVAVAGAALVLPWHGPTHLEHGQLPPSIWILGTLLVSVGVPFVVLAATGPLLQRWAVAIPTVRTPYLLYALGNGSSLAALVAYPTLLERYLPLTAPSGPSPETGLTQHGVWSCAFLVFASLILACALQTAFAPGANVPARRSSDRPTSLGQRLTWVGLAALPSALMLSTTQALATDVASVPLLWVGPVAVYLLSFIVAFAVPGRFPVWVASWATVVLVLGIAASQWTTDRPNPVLALPLYLATLLAVGLLCHARLAEQRPPVGSVTSFYLWIAAGSAAGSFSCGLIAPLVFRSVAEYPLTLVLACLVVPTALQRGSHHRKRWWRLIRNRAVPGVVALSFLAIAVRKRLAGEDLLEVRTFFGVLRVRDAWGPAFVPLGGPHVGQQVRLPLRELYHGTTLHGVQVTRPSLSHLPTTYYHPSGPIGRVFAAVGVDPGRSRLLAHVGVVGLGVGSLAAYAKSGERFSFFEIDPEVVRIARDPKLFSFLSDCEGDIDVVVGDGRIALANEPDATFGLLIVDAFSSDAVPVHLLTREALALALRKLWPGGLVAYHLSSNFFDLSPVIAEAATSLGQDGVYWDDEALSATEVATAKQPSKWAVLGDSGAVSALKGTDGWVPLASRRRLHGGPWLWTDRYSSPLAALSVAVPLEVHTGASAPPLAQ